MARFRRLDLMHHAAEYLVMGHLLRRNILCYKAPANHEGYDLLCLHPNPRKRSDVKRIQVKSRYQTDSDRSVFIREESFHAFDFLVIALLNIGWYYSECRYPSEGRQTPEFIVLPRAIARRFYSPAKSGMHKVRTMNRCIDGYTNDRGSDLIARSLRVRYPNPSGAR